MTFSDPKRAFTLVELLVVVSLIGVLAALLVPSVASSVRKAQSLKCTANLRTIGQAILLHANDTGEFPRSLHSCAGAGAESWAKSILPYLGERAALPRCPSLTNRDPNVQGYGLNVYFELDPDGDDYAGSPATWRRPSHVPRPAATILAAESRAQAFADHFMCHQWSGLRGASNTVDTVRHGKNANYLFVDGHVETLEVAETFDPSRQIDLWNPSRARRQ